MFSSSNSLLGDAQSLYMLLEIIICDKLSAQGESY